jgi:hypothetical protein
MKSQNTIGARPAEDNRDLFMAKLTGMRTMPALTFGRG